MDWIWIGDPLYRYRDAATGRFVGQGQVNDASGTSVESAQDLARVSGAALVNGDVTLGAWQRDFRQQIKDEYIRQYGLGIGGVDQMTAVDRGSIGGMLAEQYRYLDRLVAQTAAGEVSPARLIQRSMMYLNSSREALFRAMGRARGIETGEAPAHPGDGSTQCLTNCLCAWVYQRRGNEWNLFWTLSPAEHCPTCLERAEIWNPYVVPISEPIA